jgi:hypothetical protein
MELVRGIPKEALSIPIDLHFGFVHNMNCTTMSSVRIILRLPHMLCFDVQFACTDLSLKLIKL